MCKVKDEVTQYQETGYKRHDLRVKQLETNKKPY